jgi:protoporphyrinogen oxidase
MIAVVGGGLAGLACAQELHRRGLAFRLFEASDKPGGRVRSDHADGFTLDRGFQVILSSYDAVRKVVDIPSLRPRFFEQGAILSFDRRMARIRNPLTHPASIPGTLLTSAFSAGDKVRLACELLFLLTKSEDDLTKGCGKRDDVSVAQWLESRRFSGKFIDRFMRPFFGGVLLDNGLDTSAALFLSYLKKFTLGRAWIPAGGIEAFPAAIAATLPPGSLAFNQRVTGIETSGNSASSITLADGSRLPVTGVVLALDEPALDKLTGRPARPGRPVAVVYFKTLRPLYQGRLLVLPSAPNPVVRHFVQITNIAPEYAPPGWHLVSASVLDPDRHESNQLAHLAAAEITGVFPHAAGNLTPIATTRVAYAVPNQPPGFAASPAPLARNVFYAGDWMVGASIQSALTSGRAAAAQCE